MNSVEDVVASYATRTRFEDLDDATVRHAKLGILDTLAVMSAARRHRLGSSIVDYTRALKSAGASTVIGDEQPAAAEQAALANGTLAHLLDYDDASHSSSHILPTALALAEERHKTGAELLTAYVVGREVRMHLNKPFDSNRAAGDGPGGRGWHSTGVVGSLASAAAGANVLDLDQARSRMAIGISASLACGVNSNWGTMTKPLHAGSAARNGVLAASLADSGFTAADDALTGAGGLVEALSCSQRLDFTDAAAELGKSSYLGVHGPQAKRYPCCFASHGYIDAVKRLLAEHPIEVADVESVQTTRNRSLRFRIPTDDLECKFSAAFIIAATIVSGTVTLESCTHEFLARPDVQRLLDRTTYVDTVEGRQLVRITLTDGATYELPVLPVERPADAAHIEQKFKECTAGVLSDEGAAAVLEQIQSLETLDSLDGLQAALSVRI